MTTLLCMEPPCSGCGWQMTMPGQGPPVASGLGDDALEGKAGSPGRKRRSDARWTPLGDGWD